MKKTLSILGLSLNLIGSILIAFSLSIIYIDQIIMMGFPASFTHIKPLFFYGGLISLGLGFLLQIIEKIKK